LSRVEISNLEVKVPSRPRVVVVGDPADALLDALAAGGFQVERALPARPPDVYLLCGAARGALLELAARLRADAATTAVPILGAGGADGREALEAVRAGVDDWLAEPIDPERVVARLWVLVTAGARARAVAERAGALLFFRDWVRYLVHDLRSPLGVALGNVNYVEPSAALADDEREALREAAVALERSRAMLQDLLDTDRLRHGALAAQRSRVDLAALARDAISALRAAPADLAPIQLEVFGDSMIDGDTALLRRVLDNLVGNALRFGAGRPIDVEVAGGLHVVTVRVRNRGPAVSDEARERLFDPLTPIGHEGGGRVGTGLGLAFARMAVAAHDGRLWLESAETGNVVFTFELPRAAP
jgi:signal transduction histidine kinase